MAGNNRAEELKEGEMEGRGKDLAMAAPLIAMNGKDAPADKEGEDAVGGPAGEAGRGTKDPLEVCGMGQADHVGSLVGDPLVGDGEGPGGGGVFQVGEDPFYPPGFGEEAKEDREEGVGVGGGKVSVVALGEEVVGQVEEDFG